MPKDCGCNKKDDKDDKKDHDDCSNKKKRNQIWVYKKKCDIKLNVPDNSYLGKNGFAYYLVNNDKKESTEYKVNFKISNLNPGEIVYYVLLYKVSKTKINKKTNTIKKYLECVSQYSYTSKIEQYTMINIINSIGNDNYDIIPHNTNEFNGIVIQNILKKNGKKGISNNSYVNLIAVGKGYGDAGCNGNCSDFQTCGSSCPTCEYGIFPYVCVNY